MAEVMKEFKKEKERKIGRKNRRMEKYMRRKEGRTRGGISVVENRRKKDCFHAEGLRFKTAQRL